MATVLIVHTLDAQGKILSHRLFTKRELADKHMGNTLPFGHKYRLVEREAVSAAAARLAAIEEKL